MTVGNIYSDNARRPRNKTSKRPVARKVGTKRPSPESRSIPIAAAGLLTLLLCITVNYRAYVSMTREESNHGELNQQVQELMTTNISLQDEIQSVNSDHKTVEREARKFGYERPKN